MVPVGNPIDPLPTHARLADIEGSNRQWDDQTDISEAGVVHDLGNLIQVATSAISVIARNPDMPTAQSGPMLERARSCLDQAGALVRKNIGLVRGRSIAGSDSTDIAACLDDVATLVEAMGEPGLALKFDIEPGLPRARCEAMGLQNAVLNLVFNARDAMPAGGLVTVAAQLDSDCTGVELQVIDTGIGMSRATIVRAFEPFFTTKSDGLGGVGLAMVHRFVRDAGGDIALESKRGVGTRVTLRLPAVPHASLHRS
jgi:signal transduction histidine kinase